MSSTNQKQEQEEQSGQWDSLLTEEPKEGEEYIKPNIETKLSPEKRKECREIVREIRNFGVSQRQILYLVYLLSLELEDVVTMKALAKAVGENRENIPVDLIEKGKTESKLIL